MAPPGPSSISSSATLSTSPISVTIDTTLQHPLSRRKNGPGLLLIVPKDYSGRNHADANRTLDPEPLQKWAEEGFIVVEVKVDANQDDIAVVFCDRAIRALLASPRASYDKFGVIVYGCSESIQSRSMQEVWRHLCQHPAVAAIITYNEPASGFPHVPYMVHSTSRPAIPQHDVVLHTYEAVSSTKFVLPGHPHYQAGPAGVAHTRSLGFLRKYLGGPHFDLEAIWEEHTRLEFGERDVESTMNTMVEEPYVNHVPTMTGGVGRTALTAFYRDHFIFNNPEDTQLELLSRTVGIDRVIDEFIFSFTHNKVIDWLVPGIPPTGKHVRIPFTSVVNIRGDRLYHEHIAWDQASVLRQLGLLPEYLHFPYPLPDGRVPAQGKRFEYRVPAAGVETAKKLVDESSVASNEMLGFEIREVDDV